MRKVCLTTYVFGNYERYIPYYLFSALKTYPEYFVKIFVEDDLSRDVWECVERVRQNISGNFVIKKWRFEHRPANGLELKVDVRTIYRYILPPEEFLEFDYVYVGDVDIFIIPEQETLADFHMKHIGQIGIPISNCIRKDSQGNYTDRLTGLHFYKTQEYYAVVGDEIRRLASDSNYFFSSLEGCEWDEQLLYKMVAKGFDMERFKVSSCIRPWHGLHLGAARKYKPTKATEERFINNFFEPVESIRAYMETVLRDPTLQHIAISCDDRSFFNFLIYLGVKIPNPRLRFRKYKYQTKAIVKDAMGLLRR